MPSTCLVPKCDSNKSRKVNTNVSTFKVPDEETEKTLYEKWLAAIPGCNVMKKNHRICEKHFRKEHVIKAFVSRNGEGEVISITPYKHPRLAKGAVPCIFSKSSDKLDEHASITKCSTSSNETANSSEEINVNKSWAVSFKLSTDKEWTGCHFTDSLNIGAFNKSTDNRVKESSTNATMDKSTSDETVNNPNRLSKLQNDQILINSAATAIFQSVSFDFDGKSGNPNARVKLIIDLIKPWNAARAVFGNEEYLILSHIIETVVSGKKCHVLEKAVLLAKDRKITYEVYGRPCDVDDYNLPNLLENVTKLTEILIRFKDLPVCKGVQILNFNYLTSGTKTFYKEPWRPDDCALICLEGDKCPSCQKQTQMLSLLNCRRKKNAKLQRVLRLSNLRDRKKLNALCQRKRKRNTEPEES